MAGQDWSITIRVSGGSTTFDPNPQQAENSDLVSWNNRTGETHQPWPLDAEGALDPNCKPGESGYLSDPIDPWSSSSPAYVCAAPQQGSTTIAYGCKFHENERGSIVVSA